MYPSRKLMSLIVPLLLGVPSALHAQPFELVGSWGSFGTGPGQFHYSRGIAVDKAGRVYVSDEVNGRVQVFDADGAFLSTFGGTGTGPARMGNPWGVGIGPDGSVYVAQPNIALVKKYTAAGGFVADISVPGWVAPWDVDLDRGGNLYVVAQESHRVYKIKPDGTLLTSWGGEGSGNGQFEFPRGGAVGPDGSVFVLDTNNSRVQKFDPNGGYLLQWFTASSGGIDVDRFGNVYVASFDFRTLQKFDSQGNLAGTWDASDLEPFATLLGVAANGHGDLYVTDTNNMRVLHLRDLAVPMQVDCFEDGDLSGWSAANSS